MSIYILELIRLRQFQSLFISSSLPGIISIGYCPEPLQIRMGCAESRTAPEPDDESDLPLKKSSYSASELRRSIVSINKDHDINTVYDCDTGSRVMGSGATATVKTIRHRKTGVEYALKSIRLNRMDSKFNVHCFPVVVFVCSVPLMWCLSSNHPILIWHCIVPNF